MKKIVAVVLGIATLLMGTTACSDIKNAGGLSGGVGKDYSLEDIDTGLVKANTGFAFDIFKQLNKEDPENNVFISPYSISTALTMTCNGAQTTTKDTMERVLGYKDKGVDKDVVNKSSMNLLGYLHNADSKIELNTANSIWIREGEKIEDDFLSTNREHFYAEVEMLDFSKNNAAEKINNWISDATKGKIEKMISPPIPFDVVMYLINAIYFKGQWTEEFDPELTYDEVFNLANGEKKDVRMMHRKGKLEYGRGEDFKAVSLPYGRGDISMYCILPDEEVEVNQFINSMDAEKWEEILRTLIETDDVILKIPKFKMEYGIKNLNDSLKLLGMGEAFSANADFSGIRKGLYISRVLHKAVIEVNEEGSEAAAVTVVVKQETAAEMNEPITFIADRPFVFVIADNQTGTLLFMGKAYDI